MKILLIEPYKASEVIGSEDFSVYEPLALEYVGAGVTNDHEVQILDLRLENNLEDVLQKFTPDIVGITAYTVQVNIVISLFKKIKLWNQKTLNVVGGHHATIKPEDFNSEDIDIIVMGEGINTFKEIVKRYDDGRGFDKIPGTAIPQKGTLMRLAPSAINELDSFPFPARELTEKYRTKYYSYWMKPLASIRTSKGMSLSLQFLCDVENNRWEIL